MEKAQAIQEQIKNIFGDTPVYLVGGSVRDIILKKEPKDWDYCTPLEPEEIEKAVRAAGRKPYLTGKRFGTIGFKVAIDRYQSDNPKEWVYIEVTTYRKEQYTSISRKPFVEFIDDLDVDLSRRDFTINSMVLKDDGEYYDPHGGRLDLLARQIVTVGSPKDRIQEDPLRMLRAARFASQLDFSVDPNMIGKMRQLGDKITIVSKERWVQELDKLLTGKNPMRGIKVLMQSDVMKYILPEVYLSLQNDAAYQEMADVFDKYPDMDVDSCWGTLLYFVGHPYTIKENKGFISFPNSEIVKREIIDGIASRLKFSNDRRDALKKPIVFKNININ